MREELLHYIWKYQRFSERSLTTLDGSVIHILKPGIQNFDSGPDFFNARLKIDGQLWAGNVEIHIKSSDWYAHAHHGDSAYENVILHVVWEFNKEVLRANGTKITTLELKSFVEEDFLSEYENLMNSKMWINCERDFHRTDSFVLMNWLQRLYVERLEEKSNSIKGLLEFSKNDWEQVLFILLFKGFGLKVNADSFESSAKSIDYSIVRKTRFDLLDLEALFMGQSKLLDPKSSDAFELELLKRYRFLAHKYQLSTLGVLPMKYFRLRPSNFPDIRLAQLAALFHKSGQLFSKLIRCATRKEVKAILQVSPSDYWLKHYRFGTGSRKSKRNLSDAFINLLIINIIIPLKYVYESSQGKLDIDSLFNLIQSIPIEQNKIVERFLSLKTIPKDALSSQGLIQLKNNYCNKNRCLSCPVAKELLL